MCIRDRRYGVSQKIAGHDYRETLYFKDMLIHEILVPCGGLLPVSYTHLDVYKRQTVSNVTQTASIQVDDSGITINGVYYTPKEFEELLDTAEPIDTPKPRVQTRSAAIAGASAGAYFIPGVGEVLIAATGAVIVGGVAITAGNWAYKKIVSYFKEHTDVYKRQTLCATVSN